MQAMCSACRHSQRSRTDQDLRAGRDLRSLSDEFGLRTGALRHHRGRARGRPAHVALTHAGDAHVTDSLSPYLYRVSERAPNEFQLERFLELRGTPGFKLNGIVATRDGRFLITVQSNTGQLFRIDLATKTIITKAKFVCKRTADGQDRPGGVLY
jgi:hypothetical protein